MAILLKKLVASPFVVSCRPLAVGSFKSFGFDNLLSEEKDSRIIELDYFRYNKYSIRKILLNGVYSFTDVVCPSSPIKKLEYFLNRIDNARWHVKESTDNLFMVRRTAEGEANIRVDLDMDGEPKDFGCSADLHIFRWPKAWFTLYNPSATLLIQRKPHVESDESLMVAVKLSAGLFHTNATTIETTECGDWKITLKKLKTSRIKFLFYVVPKDN